MQQLQAFLGVPAGEPPAQQAQQAPQQAQQPPQQEKQKQRPKVLRSPSSFQALPEYEQELMGAAGRPGSSSASSMSGQQQPAAPTEAATAGTGAGDEGGSRSLGAWLQQSLRCV